MKKRLGKGENPNENDLWYSTQSPITFAHSLEAVKLLCEHGAKVTPDFLHNCLWHDTAILRYLTQNDLCKELASPSRNHPVVYAAVMIYDKKGISFQDNYQKISLLLQCGFSPNAVSPSDFQYRHTALDWVDKMVHLKKSEKKELRKLLKQYGAVTYVEAARKSSAFPRFTADNYDINPIFKRAEKFLYESRNTESFVVSTTCPSVNGPVLVIDRLPWDHHHENKSDRTTRTTAMVHRRETPLSWRQESEPLEIPLICRMVLTPPGVKLPSRIKGKYLQNIISEQWYSTDDFEVYEEINCQNYEWNRHRISELRAITRNDTKMPELDDQAIPKPMERHCLAEELTLCSPGSLFYPETDIDKHYNSRQEIGRAFLKKARETFERKQFAGRWFFMSDYLCYCFSTHRSVIPENVKDVMPHPSEILVRIGRFSYGYGDKDERHVYDNSRQGLAYWNWRELHVHQKGRIEILYGDDVSEERLQEIESLAVDLLNF